jgi:tetratricopeptide (TPR) repeat protein
MLAELARKPKPTHTIDDVTRILKDAAALIQNGKVTEALEKRAQAMFVAPRAAIDPEQKGRLDIQIKDLSTAIYRIRGQRAVADAETCLNAGDAEALQVLIAEAYKDLPEFVKEPECRKAYENAAAFAKRSIARPTSTEFGRSVLFRHEYEQALDYFREGKLVGAVEAADRARRRATDDAARIRVLDLAANALETAILTTESSDRDRARRSEIRAALAKAEPWLGETRLQKLDGQLRPLETTR